MEIEIKDEESFQEALHRNKTIESYIEIGNDCSWQGWLFSHKFLKNTGCKSYEDFEIMMTCMTKTVENNDRKESIKKAKEQWIV